MGRHTGRNTFMPPSLNFGTKSNKQVFIPFLNSFKTVVTICAIDYDLAPEVTFPAPIIECEKVVKKIYEDEYCKLKYSSQDTSLAPD